MARLLDHLEDNNRLREWLKLIENRADGLKGSLRGDDFALIAKWARAALDGGKR